MHAGHILCFYRHREARPATRASTYLLPGRNNGVGGEWEGCRSFCDIGATTGAKERWCTAAERGIPGCCGRVLCTLAPLAQCYSPVPE